MESKVSICLLIILSKSWYYVKDGKCGNDYGIVNVDIVVVNMVSVD